MSHDLDTLRRAVEEDGDDLTSDEATALFATLDAARARIAALEGNRTGDYCDLQTGPDEYCDDERMALRTRCAFHELESAHNHVATLEVEVQRLQARVLHLHLYATHAVGFLNEALDGN